jgi:uncharacterized protein YdhG (YjbR/CyaY superfamily)
MKNAPTTIDEYIASFPEDVQALLHQVRDTIRKAAPQAQEAIKYAMPAYVLNGNLVYFAAFKNHIGFYAVPSGIDAFQQELAAYKGGKGSVQFPLDEPLPLELIAKIVEFRVNENLQKKLPRKAKASSAWTDLGAPARRALETNGVTTLETLAQLTETQVLKFHGMGKSSLPKLREALMAKGLSFKSGDTKKPN